MTTIYDAAQAMYSAVEANAPLLNTADFPATASDDVIQGIADTMQEIIASFVGTLIDAGSERDAVNEDEDLNLALRTLLRGWVPPS